LRLKEGQISVPNFVSASSVVSMVGGYSLHFAGEFCVLNSTRSLLSWRSGFFFFKPEIYSTLFGGGLQ